VDGLLPVHWKQTSQMQDDMQLKAPCSHPVPIWRLHPPYDVSRTYDKAGQESVPSIFCGRLHHHCPQSRPSSLSHVSLKHESRSLLFPCHGPVDNDHPRVDFCGLDVSDETQPQTLLSPHRSVAVDSRHNHQNHASGMIRITLLDPVKIV